MYCSYLAEVQTNPAQKIRTYGLLQNLIFICIILLSISIFIIMSFLLIFRFFVFFCQKNAINILFHTRVRHWFKLSVPCLQFVKTSITLPMKLVHCFVSYSLVNIEQLRNVTLHRHCFLMSKIYTIQFYWSFLLQKYNNMFYMSRRSRLLKLFASSVHWYSWYRNKTLTNNVFARWATIFCK